MDEQRVLIIDDDEFVRKHIRTILERAGFIALEARNGDEGLIKVAEAVPDLVITDLLMPEKDGIETIIQLRKSHPDIKIIAMSGGGHVIGRDVLKSARLFGAAITLIKPFLADELLQAVHKLTDRNRT